MCFVHCESVYRCVCLLMCVDGMNMCVCLLYVCGWPMCVCSLVCSFARFWMDLLCVCVCGYVIVVVFSCVSVCFILCAVFDCVLMVCAFGRYLVKLGLCVCVLWLCL